MKENIKRAMARRFGVITLAEAMDIVRPRVTDCRRRVDATVRPVYGPIHTKLTKVADDLRNQSAFHGDPAFDRVGKMIDTPAAAFRGWNSPLKVVHQLG